MFSSQWNEHFYTSVYISCYGSQNLENFLALVYSFLLQFVVKLVVPKTPDGHDGVFLNTSYPLKQKELVEHGPCRRFGSDKCKGVLASFEMCKN